jgi:YD repeat-containing protein
VASDDRSSNPGPEWYSPRILDIYTATTPYDELGRSKSVLSPDSTPAGASEQPLDRLTTWTYGHLGRVVTETRPDGAAITRSYDERGNLISSGFHRNVPE